MGLDFDGSDAHWSYSGFHYFRKCLAADIGIKLEEMQGFGGSKSWDEVNDPIKILLYHSDCDGELAAEECEQIYPRLLEIVEKWEDDDEDMSDNKEQGILLAKGMKKCAEKGKPLIFC